MQNPLLKQTVVADFFGHGYRVSGTLNVTKRPLADTVFDPTTDFLELSDAYLSPVTDPATIGGYYRTTLYNKGHIDFILTAEQKDGLRRDQVYILSQRKFEVSLTVPFFELQGDLYSLMTISSGSRHIGAIEKGLVIHDHPHTLFTNGLTQGDGEVIGIHKYRIGGEFWHDNLAFIIAKQPHCHRVTRLRKPQPQSIDGKAKVLQIGIIVMCKIKAHRPGIAAIKVEVVHAAMVCQMIVSGVLLNTASAAWKAVDSHQGHKGKKDEQNEQPLHVKHTPQRGFLPERDQPAWPQSAQLGSQNKAPAA